MNSSVVTAAVILGISLIISSFILSEGLKQAGSNSSNRYHPSPYTVLLTTESGNHSEPIQVELIDGDVDK